MRMGSKTIQHEKHPNKTSKHANQKVPEDSNSFNFWKGRNKIHTTQLQPTHNSSEHLKLKRTSFPHPETVDGRTRDEEMEAQATPRPLSIAQFVATIRVDHRPKKVSSLHCRKKLACFLHGLDQQNLHKQSRQACRVNKQLLAVLSQYCTWSHMFLNKSLVRVLLVLVANAASAPFYNHFRTRLVDKAQYHPALLTKLLWHKWELDLESIQPNLAAIRLRVY